MPLMVTCPPASPLYYGFYYYCCWLIPGSEVLSPTADGCPTEEGVEIAALSRGIQDNSMGVSTCMELHESRPASADIRLPGTYAYGLDLFTEELHSNQLREEGFTLLRLGDPEGVRLLCLLLWYRLHYTIPRMRLSARVPSVLSPEQGRS
jgi:hypothetical protein